MVFFEPATPPQTPPQTPPHVLVVEDDPENGRLFTIMLASAGYTVTQKTTVQGAIEVLQAQSVSLVLVDWYLPDGTATLVCEEVKRQNRATPVILITGQADLRTLQIDNADFDRWLSKPTTAQKLLSAVRQLLAPDSSSSNSHKPDTY